MGTRSLIGILNKDGSIKLKYCHWDGYFSGVGAELFKYYNNESRARELVHLGDMSSLYPHITPDPAYPHTFDNPQKGVSIFYGRDRGESGKEAADFSNLHAVEQERDGFEEYLYLWSGHLGEWIACKSYCSIEQMAWHKLSDIAANDYDTIEGYELDEWLSENPDEEIPRAVPTIDYSDTYLADYRAPITLVPVELF